MLVVENPSDFEGSVSFGSFVLLKVDIAASLRGVTDQTAVAAVEALPRAKCLAWIRTYTAQLGSPLFYVIFLLVGRGLPATQPFAAVPIAPCPPHPDTGRAAVDPSRPFPWPDCYIYTTRTLTAPMSRLCTSPDPQAGIALDAIQKRHVLLSCFADGRVLAQARREAAVASGYAVRSGIRVRDHGSHGSVFEEDSADCSETSSEGSSAQEDGAAADAVADHKGSSAASEPSSDADGPPTLPVESCDFVEEKGITLYVEVSGVLDASDDFGTADEFLAAIERLAEIEAARAQREEIARLARAVAPKTVKWLRGIASAHEPEEAGAGGCRGPPNAMMA